MTPELWTLTGLAAWLGFFHTVVGPDHYVPFIVMAKARQWSLSRTAAITFLCGLGHVLSSVVLGFIGIAVGIAVGKLEWFEGSRGDIAAWLLTVFGFLYMLWGIRRAYLNRPHTHKHLHLGGVHEHEHSHDGDHAHSHTPPTKANITPWVLFTIFVFGPCEPLIPLLMYPAAKLNTFGVVVVAGVFSAVTVGMMMLAVLTATFGLSFVPTRQLQRYTHALAGAAVFLCGVAIHVGL